MSHCRKKMPRVLRGKKNQCKQWGLMKEVKLKRKFSKGKEREITEYTPHTSHLSAVISLAEIKCFTWNRLKQSSDLNWRRQWHPTPVLLPGKSHGQGAWKATVHGVTEGQTRLSDFTFTFHFHALEKEMATHSSVLAWRIPGLGKPGGLPSMGSHRVGHDWSDLAAAAVI